MRLHRHRWVTRYKRGRNELAGGHLLTSECTVCDAFYDSSPSPHHDVVMSRYDFDALLRAEREYRRWVVAS